MFTYELQQTRRSELEARAEQWRLVKEAKAARADARRARKGAVHAAHRSGSTGDLASDVVPVPLIKKAIDALHLHSAA